MDAITLPSEIGSKIGSRSGLIECTRLGPDEWEYWSDGYDGTGMMFGGSDADIKALIEECRTTGYDPMSNTWNDKFGYQVGLVKTLVDNYLAGTVDKGSFVGELKRLSSLMEPNRCACWKCLGMSDPYADDPPDNHISG